MYMNFLLSRFMFPNTHLYCRRNHRPPYPSFRSKCILLAMPSHSSAISTGFQPFLYYFYTFVVCGENSNTVFHGRKKEKANYAALSLTLQLHIITITANSNIYGKWQSFYNADNGCIGFEFKSASTANTHTHTRSVKFTLCIAFRR